MNYSSLGGRHFFRSLLPVRAGEGERGEEGIFKAPSGEGQGEGVRIKFAQSKANAGSFSLTSRREAKRESA